MSKQPEAIVNATKRTVTGESRRAYATAIRIDRSPLWSRVSVLLLISLLSLIIWSRHAQIEQITKGIGEVVPSSRVQIIQSLEGGILSELKIKEGMVVEQGALLVVIDPTRAESSFSEMNKRRLALLASVARLQAESQGKEPKFPPEVIDDKDLIDSERATYSSRQRALQESVASLQRSVGLIADELKITEPMVKRGLVPEVEALRLRRQLNETRLQLTDRINRFRADASTELLKTQSELAQVEEVTGARRDLMERTTLKAPLRGTVKNIRINTVGGVIQPGADIMEIVPLDGGLRIEAKVSPADVAFLYPGIRAVVKLTAYDYLQYGVLEGEVESVSPDTMREDKRSNEQPFYRVVVRTPVETLSKGGKQLPVLPGMQATVDIVTGQRTVWQYFMKPLLRVQEAFREK
ncbi:HlyD family type I secretion periplasmic adaptor subunit [Dechloromonas sp. HYN0024]|uniref:HlyD family type I secretion periplasmic adaptor subunit n=1 Tax=Dechloromonas sp. HYN0024 TaxID=2231055 RepID=UPI0013C2B0A0|nr:HlyD family type I secretion periplasmic adaptor subunit [Dechloromonas sp. HYN0024]